MKIAVLITCYNRKQKTINCLNSLYNNILPDGYAFNVFLVDDNSSDGTSEAVSENFPLVSIIKGNGKLYWNRGMLLAWKTAILADDFDYYMWLNDDTFLFPNAISELIKCVQETENNAIISGFLRSEFEEKTTYGAIGKEGVKNPNGTMQEVELLNGNAIIVSRKIYKSTGLLNPIYPHAIGDHDYGYRVKKKNFKILTTYNFVGICEQNKSLPIWCLANTPLLKRLKNLYSPLGYAHPVYFFIYELKYLGIGIAVKHFFSIHLRVFFPRLWY